MNNAEKFKEIFKEFATEVWAFPEKDFLTWLNAEYKEPITENEAKYCDRNICLKNEYNNIGCEDCEVTKSQDSTTKNDLAQERYQDLIEYFGDEKVAKTILEDRKEFKAWLERLRWNVNRVDELARELEQLKETTKNDLGVDCISRKAALDITWHDPSYSDPLNVLTEVRDKIRELPSVTPQPRKGHWINKSRRSDCGIPFIASECTCCGKRTLFDCDEFLYRYCPNCGAKMEVEDNG